MSERKIKVLAYCDSPTVATGFGTVSRNILMGLHETGRYEIVVLGINYWGTPHNLPLPIYPTGINEQRDPYGRAWAAEMMRTSEFDILFTMQDSFILEFMKDVIPDLRAKNPRLKWINYFPVDGRPKRQWVEAMGLSDYPVTYTEWAKNQCVEVFPGCKDKIDYIYHGVNIKDFHPIPKEGAETFRRQYFGHLHNKFIVLNVNRNQQRKDIPRGMKAFKLFKEKCPNSLYYLHCATNDHGWNLLEVANSFGLRVNEDICFPNNFGPNQGYPIGVLNNIYNSADAVISSTTGEGWGLCLHPDTDVLTERGSIPIEDVVIGDKVIGNDGVFHKVLDTMKRKVSKLYKINHNYGEPLLLTGEHPLYVLRGEKPGWVRAKDIKDGDRLFIPKLMKGKGIDDYIDIVDFLPDDLDFNYNEDTVSMRMGFSPKNDGLSLSDIQDRFSVSKRVAEDARNFILGKSVLDRCGVGSIARGIADKIIASGEKLNTKTISVNRRIPITDEFLEFVGWYLAEGSSGVGSRVEIDLHINELSVANKLSWYLGTFFGVDCVVEKNGENKCRLRASSAVLATFMENFCGIHCDNKYINKALFNSPDRLGPLLRGLFLGDGYLNGEKRVLALTTTSRSLAYQVRAICSYFGVLVGINKKDGRIKVVDVDTLKSSISKPQYTCTVSTPHMERFLNVCNIDDVEISEISRKAAQHFCILDGHAGFFVKVGSIDSDYVYCDNVYDICVEDSHSFLANGVLVHNSQSEAMACCKPVISPDNTACTEIIGSDRGILVPSGDNEEMWTILPNDNEILRPLVSVEGVASALEKLYNDKGYANKLAINGYKWATSNIRWDKNIVPKWVELFDKAVENAKSGSITTGSNVSVLEV